MNGQILVRRPASLLSDVVLGTAAAAFEHAKIQAAYAAVANGGWLMRPRLVEHIVQGDDAQFVAPQARRQILSPQTVKRINDILVGVVERGTGKQVAIEGYTVAGKTGTAQKAERGGYSHSKILASFAGYVPAEAPQLAMLVIIDEPQRAKWGGETTGPVFKRVAQQALYYLQVPSRQTQMVSLGFQEHAAENVR